MISITSHMDEFDIVQEIRFERKVHKGSFLLLEGGTDLKRYEQFIDEKACSTVNCHGRKNAVEAIKILYEDGFMGALGIVDADFDRVNGNIEEHEGLIFSETHDLDLDLLTPTTLRRYLVQVGDPGKCATYGSPENIIEKILVGLKPVSVAKLLNRRGAIRYKLSNLDISTCFVDFTIDIDRYIELIFQGKIVAESEKSKIRNQILSLSQKDFDLMQLTNGHDFCDALGICLRCELGERRATQTWGKEVEIHIRLLFSDQSFKQSVIYNKIITWEQENPPYIVLDRRLQKS